MQTQFVFMPLLIQLKKYSSYLNNFNGFMQFIICMHPTYTIDYIMIPFSLL